MVQEKNTRPIYGEQVTISASCDYVILNIEHNSCHVLIKKIN